MIEHFDIDQLSPAELKEILETEYTPYCDTKLYSSGQLFASSQAITSLTANMLYNPALGALVREMLENRFVVVPMPVFDDIELPSRNAKYKDLYQYMMRRRNLVTVALLRRFDVIVDEDEAEPGDDEDAPPEKPPWVK